MKKEKTVLYLVRHAHAIGNEKKFFQGNVDTDLTETGYKQLPYLSERFKDIHLDALYSSPLKRAFVTAEALNKYHNLDIIKIDALKEINGGILEHMQWEDIQKNYPDEFELWKNDLPRFAAPSGEAMTDVYERMKKAVTAIAEENIGKTVTVVSHGCAIKNFLSYAESGDIEGLKTVGWSDNISVSCIEYSNGKFEIIFKSDASHLPEELKPSVLSLWEKEK